MPQLALVTGAGSGIGQAVALELSQHGYDLALLDINATGLRSTQDLIAHTSPKVQVYLHPLDISDPSAVTHAIQSLHAQNLTITHLAACAGVFRPDGAMNPQSTDSALVLSVNFTGVVNALQAKTPDLIKSKGAAVLIGSTESHRALAQMASYVASKHAVLGYGRSVAAELAPRGVRVNVVCPGSTRTGMYDPSQMTEEMRKIAEEIERKIPLRRIAEPGEVARVVRFLLSEDASYVVGALIPVDGGRTL